jgi:hypothetical protein
MMMMKDQKLISSKPYNSTPTNRTKKKTIKKIKEKGKFTIMLFSMAIA